MGYSGKHHKKSRIALNAENSSFKIFLCIALSTLLMSLFTACNKNSGNMIIVAGSTSVQPYAEVLAEEYAHSHPDQEVDIQGGGSSAGIAAAESGTAEIGMSSRRLKENEKNLWSVEIAKDGLAIIVNPGNPVSNLSLEQIQLIYSGEIRKWNYLGGPDNNIHVIAREEGSGTRSAFEELVMGNAIITPRAIVQDSNGTVKQLVADDLNAVGFISLGLLDNSVKALRVDGVEATDENISNEKYSLFRSFLFITQGPPEGLSKQFIDFVLSDAGQRILMDEGLISISGGYKQ